MQLKTSLFSRAIIKQNFKSVTWLSILYTIVLMFVYPIAMLTAISSDYTNNVGDNIKSYLQFGTSAFSIFLLIVPLIYSIVLYRYLHKPLASDYLHSLPFKRDTHYVSNYVSGVIGLLVPIILTTISIILVISLNGFSDHIPTSGILLWMITNILGHILFFTIATFILMVTGLTLVNFILYFIFIFFPFGITLLTISNISNTLLGYPRNYYYQESFDHLLYYVTFLQAYNTPFTTGQWLLFIGMLVVLFLLTWFAYRIRPLEVATQAIAFPALRPIFRYGVTFCFMLLFGSFFYETNGRDSWAYFGYVSGSLLGFIIAEMILQKSWKIGGSFKKYFWFASVIVVLIISLKFDITGYEKKVPEAADVERVWISEGDSNFRYYDGASKDEDIYLLTNYIGRFGNQYFNNPENIDQIINFHELILEEKLYLDKPYEYNPNNLEFFVLYELKDGSKISRLYTVKEDKVKEGLASVITSSETMNFGDAIKLLDKRGYGITKARVGFPNGNTKVFFKEEMNELVDVFIEDTKNVSLEDRFQESGHVNNHYLEFYFKDKDKNDHSLWFEVLTNYSSTKEWINKHSK